MTPALLLVLAAAPWSSMGEAQRADAMAALRELPMRERLLKASEGFLGTPYVLSPLGEGEGRDPDPLLRLDAVDCVTLVEQSLALSTAPGPEALLPTLTALRYADAPSWESRLHVMEAQWLPEQVRRGRLRDVTRAYGGERTRRVAKVLTEATWSEKGARALALPKAHQPLGTFEFDLIPADDAAALLAKAPAGLVVVVVRADRPWLVTRVSHVGVLVQTPKGPALRHASRSFKRVVDEPLGRYLGRNLDFGKWTVEGLALFEPLDSVADGRLAR